MLDAVMYPFDGPFVFDDDTIMPPFGFEFSLSRDEDMIVWKISFIGSMGFQRRVK